LFNSSLGAVKLWRAVLISRRVDEQLERYRSALTGKDRLIAVHGNRLMLYLVFKALGESLFNSANFDHDVAKVDNLVADLLTKITDKIALDYSQSYPAVLFKNTTKCSAIAKYVEDAEASGLEPARA
jgi:hypothetical protein